MHRGDPPSLFKAGAPVVCEGRWGTGAAFDSDRIMIRHGNEYTPPEGRLNVATSCHPTRGTAQRREGFARRPRARARRGRRVLGIVVLALGLCRRDDRLLRLGRRYAFVDPRRRAVLAVVAMEWALLSHDFSLRYVAENNARSTPLLFTITGLWAALEGSILLWGLILAGYLAVTAYHFRHRASDPLVAWAMLVGFVVALFFFVLMLGPANPFKTLGVTPADGQGPNALLQNHPLMAFHPPMLYLGYVGMTIPFTFAIAALITGRLGEGWLAETRRTTLVAWGFLSVGIILGAWWSYEVLGWGGYWAWDPVENASLLPWLTATAFMHSVIVQERRGMLRVWNLSLVVATFCLTILGTFLTRSGVLNSVHSFTESDIGPWLLGFLAFVAIGSVALDRVARRQAARAGPHRQPGVARGRVPREQPAVRRARGRGAARHRVPAARGGAAGSPALGGRAVLRPHDHADRHRAALPHGGRARAALARRRRARCCGGGSRSRRGSGSA